MAYVSIDDARYIVGKTYPGQEWKNKVNRMPDNQVIKLYYTFLERGKLDPKPKNVAIPGKRIEAKPIDDYAGGQMLMNFMFE